MEARQIWNFARPTTTTKAHCTPFTLPSNGVLTLAPSNVITLTTNAIFKPECTGSNDILLTNAGSPSSLTSLRDPFYASTLPQCYALAATTVIAYMLVIMLLITPRTFLHEGAVVLGRRGFTNGPSGSDAGIGIGGRPWLQKVAALTVAISLSIATADTFKVAEQQYNLGIMDAMTLQGDVEGGMELKIIRVISDTFLWLAQAQTLIRLFPRQREKIIIKWTAFALISLDVLFSILNDFVYKGTNRPHNFEDAVPALSYLFELALSLLYCAWVIYYAITKRRFAFYHSQMRNICLVAFLSLVAVLVPVVFFVLDISKPTLASWGDYVRWVGAAAASVGVWEWVERIEALERNDKKDGVLGREIFDGDEMLDVTPTSDYAWTQQHSKRRRDGKGGGGTASGSSGIQWSAITSHHRPKAPRDVETGETVTNGSTQLNGEQVTRNMPPLWPTRPPAAATPVSRTDTASEESTVYAIRYHPISEGTPPVGKHDKPPGPSRHNSVEAVGPRSINEFSTAETDKTTAKEPITEGEYTRIPGQRYITRQTISKMNPFRRKVQEPPPEVSAHTTKPQLTLNGQSSLSRWDVRTRIEEFAATQADKFRDKGRPNANAEPLPVMVIPAPTRRRESHNAISESQDAESRQRPRSSSGFAPWESLPSVSLTRTQNIQVIDHAQHAQLARSSDEVSLLEGQPGSTPSSSRSNPLQPWSPDSEHRDGLLLLTIPTPRRTQRSDEE
jgi:hypothetical protein